MKILLVEDNRISGHVMETDLKKAGHETVLACSARQALNFLKTIEGINVVITDLVMPVMTGLDLLREIKTSSKWKDIPVILCTSTADPRTVRDAIRMGCRHYLLKPVKAEDLLRRVDEALTPIRYVLRPKHQQMQQLGLDEESFDSLQREFARSLSQKIARLERLSEQDAIPVLEALRPEILKGATALGAERVLAVLNPSHEPAESRPENGPANVLKELKLLQSCLPAL